MAAAMIGDVHHQQLLIARAVLLVDLDAEAHGAGRAVAQRALQLAPAGRTGGVRRQADLHDPPRCVGELVDAELARQAFTASGVSSIQGLSSRIAMAQRPLKSALRLARRAAMPSWASSRTAHLLHQRVDVLVRDLIAERHLAHHQRLHRLERQRRIAGQPLDHVAGHGLEIVGLGKCAMRPSS